MTTKIEVDAHAGWDVVVTKQHRMEDGTWANGTTEIVPANSMRTIYVHSDMRILVQEADTKASSTQVTE
jgi:hypothetical protein